MKKILLSILALLIILLLVSCKQQDESKVITPENAYDIAVRLGFNGSEEEWLKSLKGNDGTDGKNGTNGKDGKNGVGITDVYVNEDGYLTVVFSDKSTTIAGYVGITPEDTSTEPPVLSKTTLTIPEGKVYLLSSDRPETKYESSDTSVAQISSDGLVVALSEGTAKITATAKDGKSATCEISVVCYEYTKLADGTLEITGYNGSQTDLVIPSEILDKTVTSIGNSAFADYFGEKNITSVIFPDTVTTIKSYAFSSSEKLVSVSFGNQLKTIENSAFSGCIKLNNVALPESLETLENAAFNMCESFTSISVPSKITAINGATFSNCTSLVSVSLGNVESIGQSAFEYCDKLESVTIPSTVKYIDEYAFAGCSLLSEVVMSESVSYFNNSFINTPWFDVHQHDDLDAITNDTVWTTIDITIRTKPILSDETRAEYVNAGTKLFRIGTLYDEAEDMTWAKVKYEDGNIYYISNKYLTTDSPTETQ